MPITRTVSRRNRKVVKRNRKVVHGCGTASCFRLALRCDCSPDGPPVAIPCQIIIDQFAHNPCEQPIIVMPIGEVCYYVDHNSPTVDPTAFEPPLTIVQPTVFLCSCQECCDYINPPPFSSCPTDQFCDAGCNTSYVAIIPTYNVPAEDGAGNPCLETIPQHNIVLNNAPGCFWSGISVPLGVSIICEFATFQIQYQDLGLLGCNFDNISEYRWEFTLTAVGVQAAYFSAGIAISTQCAYLGTYLKINSAPAWFPNSVTIA